MTQVGAVQIAFYLLCLLLCIKPLGTYIALVFQGNNHVAKKILSPIERFFVRCLGETAQEDMDWKKYLIAALIFNLCGFVVAYAIQRGQFYLPLNPEKFGNVSPALSFNTAISFMTNTDWQNYSGENTLSYFTQMLALVPQNFCSAATGISLLIGFMRGMVATGNTNLGNFWVDTIRGILYILLPLSLILAGILVSQGVIQNFKPYQKVSVLQIDKKTADEQEQIIPMGPVASQVAIKELGSNGGGFFNANSAHPFENPTPLTDFLEMLAIMLIPASLCYTYGYLVKDTRQGWAILSAMLFMFIPLIVATTSSEQAGNPKIIAMHVDATPQRDLYPAGNMEGKETRNGIVSSSMWATATTATSSGSVNSMHDSFLPIGGLFPLWLIQLDEVVFGGVGSGLYGMLMFIIMTVFVAGLMVGRTPEYLGKKIEPFEMKMASFAILITPIIALLFTAVAVVIPEGVKAIGNPGPHGFSEVLYAFSSMANNNGSAFAGLSGNSIFYNLAGGIAMMLGRYWLAIPMLAIAGSLSKKKIIPAGLGTLPTHNFLFIALSISVTLIIGALTFLPALALGPFVEQVMLGQ